MRKKEGRAKRGQRLSHVSCPINAQGKSLPLGGIPSAHQAHTYGETGQGDSRHESKDEQLLVAADHSHEKSSDDGESHGESEDAPSAKPVREQAQRDSSQAAQQ